MLGYSLCSVAIVLAVFLWHTSIILYTSQEHYNYCETETNIIIILFQLGYF